MGLICSRLFASRRKEERSLTDSDDLDPSQLPALPSLDTPSDSPSQRRAADTATATGPDDRRSQVVLGPIRFVKICQPELGHIDTMFKKTQDLYYDYHTRYYRLRSRMMYFKETLGLPGTVMCKCLASLSVICEPARIVVKGDDSCPRIAYDETDDRNIRCHMSQQFIPSMLKDFNDLSQRITAFLSEGQALIRTFTTTLKEEDKLKRDICKSRIYYIPGDVVIGEVRYNMELLQKALDSVKVLHTYAKEMHVEIVEACRQLPRAGGR